MYLKSSHHLTINLRVLLSSGLMSVIFLLAVLFSVTVFQKNMRNVAQFERVSDESTLILKLNVDLANLQRNVLGYSDSNHQSAFVLIQNSFSELESDLATISESVKNDSRRDTVASMMELYDRYEIHIESLRESRELQNELIFDFVPDIASETFKLTYDLRDLIAAYEHPVLLAKYHSVTESLLEAKIHMITYFTNRQYQEQQSALSKLSKANSVIEALISSYEFDSETLEKFEEQLLAIENYQTVFSQTVQAMRGYLFLVNVVMEGEAQEFSVLSNLLTAATFTLLENLKFAMQVELTDDEQIISMTALVAILLGTVFSFIIGRSISKPIQEISRTFDQLATGDYEIPIPGLERADEIGRLAKSAAVYRDINLNTKKHLAESKKLAATLQAREVELKAKARELEKSNEQLDNFAYVASHDLRSPLRAIDSLADWISEDCEDLLPAESKAHLSKLKLRITRMEALLNDLLEYSRIAKTDVEIDKVSVPALVNEVIMMIDHPQEFEFVFPETEFTLQTVALPLRQVLLNLLSNAVKYSDKDHGRVELGWQEQENGFVEFSVKDNGPGIDAQFHEKVFKMFQTLNPRDTIEGSGMGLAIVKKIIEGLGGEIKINPSSENGVTFIFTWPLDYTAS